MDGVQFTLTFTEQSLKPSGEMQQQDLMVGAARASYVLSVKSRGSSELWDSVPLCARLFQKLANP